MLCFCFFLIGKVFAFQFTSCCQLLRTGCFRLDTDSPDESRQFTSNRSHGFSLVLACCYQLHVAFVQADLGFPCNLGDLC